jgi:hypothetical protein
MLPQHSRSDGQTASLTGARPRARFGRSPCPRRRRVPTLWPSGFRVDVTGTADDLIADGHEAMVSVRVARRGDPGWTFTRIERDLRRRVDAVVERFRSARHSSSTTLAVSWPGTSGPSLSTEARYFVPDAMAVDVKGTFFASQAAGRRDDPTRGQRGPDRQPSASQGRASSPPADRVRRSTAPRRPPFAHLTKCTRRLNGGEYGTVNVERPCAPTSSSAPTARPEALADPALREPSAFARRIAPPASHQASRSDVAGSGRLPRLPAGQPP